MNLTITGHHLEITDSLRSYVKEKLDKLERHFDNVTDIQVLLSVEKQRQKAEATVHVTGATLFADSVEESMYAAIDSMTDKLDRQIIKHKEKAKDHHRKEKGQLDKQVNELLDKEQGE